jgi:peptidyl-prolyl cis-trans isomerase B (cyclophilin B)
VLLAVAGAVIAACGGGSKSSTDTTAAASSQAAAPAATTPATSGACKTVAAPKPHKDGGQTKPTGKLDASKTYTVTVQTNCGEFAFTLDVKDSPHTTAAFAGLAKKGFFDGLTFHRIVPGFVIQGGDPTGSGEGGPGFSTVDKPPSDATYTAGVVAMAKTQAEPSGTSGSQFFVVTASDAQLPPDYALLGKVTKGQDVVDKIGVLAVDSNEAPTQPVVIRQIRITTS